MKSGERKLQPMPDDIALRIRMLDRDITPESIAAAQEIYEPLHRRASYEGVEILRDQQYGPAERNRLDVFKPNDRNRFSRPILMFVHGGGFVGGDKNLKGTSYYDNIGLWAVRAGLVGINITHRLAPDAPWPAAIEDLAAAINWARDNANRFGGGPGRLFLMGQSAGAAHAAAYLAHAEFHDGHGVGVAGAILLSGLYDITTVEMRPNLQAYYGSNTELYVERSSIAGLMHSRVPLMIVIAEMEPPLFHQQGVKLLDAICRRDQACPRFLSLIGHNHLTEVFHINSGENLLESQIEEFIQLGR
jgi:acetyl esterase/lipase